MFELERAISDWRREMCSRGVKNPEILDELESHLRDDFEQEGRSNSDVECAFDSARTRLGPNDVLQMEFGKVRYIEILLGLKNRLLTLLDVPNYKLMTNMNTAAPICKLEPGWATYIKAGAFLAPSLILWTFSCIFMMPKLKQICENAGLVLPTVLQATLVATSHATLISLGLFFSFALLEWRSTAWVRYRRTIIGSGVFLINALVLLVITTMVFSALVAASTLRHVIN